MDGGAGGVEAGMASPRSGRGAVSPAAPRLVYFFSRAWIFVFDPMLILFTSPAVAKGGQSVREPLSHSPAPHEASALGEGLCKGNAGRENDAGNPAPKPRCRAFRRTVTRPKGRKGRQTYPQPKRELSAGACPSPATPHRQRLVT